MRARRDTQNVHFLFNRSNSLRVRRRVKIKNILIIIKKRMPPCLRDARRPSTIIIITLLLLLLSIDGRNRLLGEKKKGAINNH